MVLVLIRTFIIAFLLLGCAEVERNNSCDRSGTNYNPDCFERYSSSEDEYSSSSEVQSSSSEVPSSSSEVPSSSSSAESSSSSDDVPSSSSYEGLCADFDGTDSLHYGKMKKRFCDERDGKRYVYVTIDEKVWMAENLNYAISGSKCVDFSHTLRDNNTTYCDTYGRLYNWATAMNGAESSYSVPSGVRGVCPAGWHLPSDNEWGILQIAAGTGTSGTKLKAEIDWNSNGNISGNGKDIYGFSALPGGYGHPNGDFLNFGNQVSWWSSSKWQSSLIWGLCAEYNNDNMCRGYFAMENLFSVRCVRDYAVEALVP